MKLSEKLCETNSEVSRTEKPMQAKVVLREFALDFEVMSKGVWHLILDLKN